MPGLAPGIHVFLSSFKEGVDGRVKPGHDGECWAGIVLNNFEIPGSTRCVVTFGHFLVLPGSFTALKVSNSTL